MKFYEAIEFVRSDLDDENNYNQFFTDLQLGKFIVRGLQETNDILKLAHRYQFVVFEQYKDSYSLNGDYIRFKGIYDIENQRFIDWDKYIPYLSAGNRVTGSLAYEFRKMKIDDIRKRIYFEITGATPETYVVSSDNLSSDPPYLVVTNFVNVSFSPTWIIYNNGTNYKALKVSSVETIVGTNDCNVYISESIILDSNRDNFYNVSANEIVLTNILIDYIYHPDKSEFYIKGQAMVQLTANSTTLNYNGTLANETNLEVGDYIYINGFGSRKVTNIDTNANTITVESVYSDVLPSTPTYYEFYILKNQEELPLPIEVQNVVLEYAKYYALMRASDPNAPNQLAIARNLIEDVKYRQLQEVVEQKMQDKLTDVWGGYYE